METTKYTADIDGLIACLTDIKEACGGRTPVQVNVFGTENVVGLTSICLDNDMGNNEAIVYIETDKETVCPTQFEFYTSGEEI